MIDESANDAREMAEEIERLRAELANEKNWHKILKPCPQALLAAFKEAYERAAQVCDEQGSLQYATACDECAVQARRDASLIRALKSGEPK